MKNEVKKFISYFFVGGAAALVEWISFAIINFFVNYNISTIVAFIFSTSFNYMLGKMITFRNDNHSKNDFVLVFIVSGIGLIFNIIFMNILIEIIHIKYNIVAKVIATGLVFIWNYMSRRIFIYK